MQKASCSVSLEEAPIIFLLPLEAQHSWTTQWSYFVSFYLIRNNALTQLFQLVPLRKCVSPVLKHPLCMDFRHEARWRPACDACDACKRAIWVGWSLDLRRGSCHVGRGCRGSALLEELCEKTSALGCATLGCATFPYIFLDKNVIFVTPTFIYILVPTFLWTLIAALITCGLKRIATKQWRNTILRSLLVFKRKRKSKIWNDGIQEERYAIKWFNLVEDNWTKIRSFRFGTCDRNCDPTMAIEKQLHRLCTAAGGQQETVRGKWMKGRRW